MRSVPELTYMNWQRNRKNNYNEHDPPKIRYVTKSTKRDRLLANVPQPYAHERLTSGSEDSGNQRDKKVPRFINRFG